MRFPEDMASEQRQRDQARIRSFTRRLAYGAVAATAVFGGLAAAESPRSSSTTSDQTQVQSDDDSSSSEDFSAPTQSFQPPVAQSGGS